jgi:uncharacterized protein (TIGR02646 family)
MRALARQFWGQSYPVKKHRREALIVIRQLRKRAQAGDKDVWKALNDYGKKAGEVVIGSKIKAALRKFLAAQQGHECCYCRRWLLNNAYASPIEHVLPRATYPQFALHFWNLAVACTACNSAKTDADWGGFVANHPVYPLPAGIDHFFHPRYHQYAQHIRYVRLETNDLRFISYLGITPLGKHLCTNLLSKVVGKEDLYRSTPVLTEFEDLMRSLDTTPESPERPALQLFQATLQGLVAERVKDGGRET